MSTNIMNIKKDSSDLFEQILNDKSGKPIKILFHQFFPAFLPCLRNTFPEITSQEEELCIYLLLDVGKEEIPYLLHIQKNSINTKRYRLRKHMKLQKNESLEGFIKVFFHVLY